MKSRSIQEFVVSYPCSGRSGSSWHRKVVEYADSRTHTLLCYRSSLIMQCLSTATRVLSGMIN